jgi:rRNA-processing protein FCF1
VIEASRRQIIPDTNFIVSMLKQRRDFDVEVRSAILGRVTIVVLDLVLLELERLARKGSAGITTWANAGLAFVRHRAYPIVEHLPGPSDVDSALVAFALWDRVPTTIATIDRDLRTALRALGIPTIVPRSGHGLVVDPFSHLAT